MSAEADTHVVPEQPDVLPFYLAGKVVTGFGRGSKELGIPTANLPIDAFAAMLEQLPTGVYLGWAQVAERDPTVYPMAMSVGWNPFYKNEKKTMEVHLIHEFDEDFYGAELRAVVVEFIRPECSFDSLEALIAAIQNDIAVAKARLATEPAHAALRSAALFAPGAEADLAQLNAIAVAKATEVAKETEVAKATEGEKIGEQ